MSDIIITIAGRAGIGKTTLAQEIAAALQHCGFPVRCDSETPIASREQQIRKISAIRTSLLGRGAEIVIREQQLARQPSKSDEIELALAEAGMSVHRVEFKRSDDTEGGSCD